MEIYFQKNIVSFLEVVMKISRARKSLAKAVFIAFHFSQQVSAPVH